ncbi:hypothetical protein FF125_06320 [Aureibaculum algae]|uniref:Uncharacterized protein n=1 Tax=Aureibaculum algae TaxID=2584122 RepID=A0A5B7TPC0_9FLAO|nr:hypothetical protein [Aureibaculum algae]QCX38060.1 hypothetical protein FF125_06320 [Aureibaculum algae]
MKITITVIFLTIFTIGNAQQQPIERFVLPARDLDHNGCVHSIRVKSFHFYENKNKPDTIYREYLAIYKDKEVIKRESYTQNDSIPWQEIFYDKLGRITKVSRKNYDGKKFQIVQYFSNNSEYPNSTNFYFDDKKNESYINTFLDTLVSKQEHYMRDTLRTYSKFKYDENNRLIEHIKVNTKNGFGITIAKSITGTEDIKHLNPNDSITFSYSTQGDILIRKEYDKGELEEIIKTITNNQCETKIVQEYGWGYYNNKIITKKFVDSTKVIRYSFNRNQDTTSVLIEVRKPDKITSDWSQNGRNSKSEIIIKTENDSLGNWIKKTKIRNGILEDKILREINYCR